MNAQADSSTAALETLSEFLWEETLVHLPCGSGVSSREELLAEIRDPGNKMQAQEIPL